MNSNEMKSSEKAKRKRLQALGHGKPITRREFVARGLVGASSYLLMPSLTGLFLPTRLAFGDEPQTWTPFIVMDLNGGPSLPGNFLVGKSGGPEDLLRSYSVLGWNPRQDGYDGRFGLPMAKPSVGKITEGMLNAMSPEAQAHFRIGSYCHFAQDDIPVNRLSALLEVANAGLKGKYISGPLSLLEGEFGGKSPGPSVRPEFRPVAVTSVETLINGVGFQSLDSSAIQTRDRDDFVKNMQKRLLGQLLGREGHLSGSRPLSEVQKAIEKGIASNSIPVRPEDMDPRLDPAFQKIFKIQNASSTDQNVTIATVVKNVLAGHSGPGVIEISGCDYHDNTQGTGDAKDLEIGTRLGQIVEAAHQKRTPVMIQIISDGGISARQGSRVWTSDAGDKSMSLLAYYNPERPPQMLRTQIGAFTDGQSVDLETPIARASETSRVAAAVLANYLNIHGKLSKAREFGSDAPPRPEVLEFLSTGAIDDFLFFE